MVGGRYVCASCRAHLRNRSKLSHLGSNSTSTAAISAPSSHRRSIHESTIAKRAEADRLWRAKAEAELNGSQPTMLSVLESRGFVNQIAGEREKTEAIMRDERIGVYVGIDPTAASMHVGHLVPFMALFWMYAHGYKTYTLLGGATAAIGDPTGRRTSRSPQGPGRKHNVANMHLQLKTIWANVSHHLTQRRGVQLDVGSQRGLVNNGAWLNKLPVTQFLRMLGQHMRVGTMLGRETARFKMEQGDGLSFAEFSYPLLQGWDWWQLYKMHNVKLQIGGSDQLGNLVAGKDAFAKIAREDQFESGVDNIEGATPIAFTTPLLTTASGAKFGKSEGNAVWLDPEMTSVFDQYQFFMRTADGDVERYLKLFTFLSLEEIEAVMAENVKAPSKRVAGRRLAEEVCLALHGETLTNQAKAEHAALFGGPAMQMQQAVVNHPSYVKWEQKDSCGRPLRVNPQTNKYATQVNSQSGFEHGIVLPEHRIRSSSFSALLFWTSLVGSRSEGNRMIGQGGAYVAGRVNGQMADELTYIKIKKGLTRQTWDFVMDNGSLMILRIGKWKTKTIRIVSDQEWSKAIKQAEEREKQSGNWAEPGDSGFQGLSKKSSPWADDSTEPQPNATAKSSDSSWEPGQWLALQRRMEADDARWQREVGDLRERKSEEKRARQELQQRAMLDDHAFALNPQRKGGRRAARPLDEATPKLVMDWDKSLT